MTPRVDYSEKTEMLKTIPITGLLGDMGISVKKKGDVYVCSSPFSDDKNPSFMIYPENTFYDWSTGIGGTNIDLIMNLYGVSFIDAFKFLDSSTYVAGFSEKSSIFKTAEKSDKRRDRRFNPANYLIKDKDDHDKVRQYLTSRGLVEFGTIPAQYYTKAEEGSKKEWKKNLAVGFLHKDEYGEICGVKLRNIDPLAEPRFSARGRLFFYELHNSLISSSRHDYQDRIYLVESETSANSLYSYLKIKRDDGLLGNFIVLSFGGVTTYPKTLPLKYEHITDRRLIIDYDGDEKLFQERVKKFEYLNAKPVKLELEKGEDINTLYLDWELDQYAKELIW